VQQEDVNEAVRRTTIALERHERHTADQRAWSDDENSTAAWSADRENDTTGLEVHHKRAGQQRTREPRVPSASTQATDRATVLLSLAVRKLTVE